MIWLSDSPLAYTSDADRPLLKRYCVANKLLKIRRHGEGLSMVNR